MQLDRGKVRTDRRLYCLCKIPDGPNILTCKSSRVKTTPPGTCFLALLHEILSGSTLLLRLSSSHLLRHHNHHEHSAAVSRTRTLTCQVSDTSAVIVISSSILVTVSDSTQLSISALIRLTISDLIRLTLSDLIRLIVST